MTVCRKLGIILENKVGQIWKLSYQINNNLNQCAPKLLFLIEKKSIENSV